MYTYKGKTAMVTGASSGIGAVFARELASRGMNVVLVARSEDKLQSLADELVKKNGVKVEVIAADLGQPGVAARLLEETKSRNLSVDMLVNNAGFATYGVFDTTDPAREQQEIAVNVAALVDLTHAFLPPMLAKGGGAVINVASTGSFVPVPRQAVYGATKAFVLSFSEALTAEYYGRDIRIFALCPSATITEFFNEINVRQPKGAFTAEKVVNGGLKVFERGKHFYIPGLRNHVQVLLPRLLPRATALRIVNNVTRNLIQPHTGN